MISAELLKNQSLFRDLPTDLLLQISEKIQLREFRKRELVLKRGGPGDALVLLLVGHLQVISLAENGREVGINLIEPGDFFGEIALIDGGERSASVVALTQSVVGLFPRAEALWHFRHTPAIAERIQRRLCATIRREIQYRVSLGGASAYHRVCALLLGHRPMKEREGDVVLDHLPSQLSLASMANVSRETVNRAMSQLSREGVIERDGSRLIIRDLARLERLANGQL
jgi:CRP-like cAMP-binding protein